MKNHLYPAIKNRSRVRFHIPGHKGKTPVGFDAPAFDLDTTELPGTDNLYAPGGIIFNAQEKIAKLHNAAASFFLTNGSTAGILSAMLACLKPMEKVLIPRNCHASVISGLIHTGAAPVFMYPKDTGCGFYGRITAQTIASAFDEHSDIRAVIVTSPTYEGIVSDIQAISAAVKAHNAYLIIDAAHGAHFVCSRRFPPYPARADIVISGLHKTLPVPGQGAVINIHNPALVDKVLSALTLVQSSSPSYFIMSAADFFFENFINKRYNFETYIDTVQTARAALGSLNNIRLFSDEPYDITKIVLLYNEKNSGILKRTLDENNIDIEAVYPGYALCVSSIADSAEDLDALTRACIEADKQSFGYPAEKIHLPAPDITSEPALTPRQAYFGDYTYYPLDSAPGRIAARSVFICPPGVPVIIPGCVITRQQTEYIKKAIDTGITPAGLYKGGVLCI